MLGSSIFYDLDLYIYIKIQGRYILKSDQRITSNLMVGIWGWICHMFHFK